MGSFNAKLKNSDVENVKDGLHAMQGWIEAKLDGFYLEVQDELAGSGSKAIKIPVVSVVRKNRSTFVKDASIDQNKISACVRSAVGNVISGDWEDVVTDILKGALCVFLGDSETSAGGQMQEHKSMHVVWADNALLRLDLYVVRFDVSQKSDFQKHAQYFAGHMLVTSIVDFGAISSEIVAYELTRFIRRAAKVKREDGIPRFKNPKEKVLNEIKDVKSILEGVTGILRSVEMYQENLEEECDETKVEDNENEDQIEISLEITDVIETGNNLEGKETKGKKSDKEEVEDKKGEKIEAYIEAKSVNGGLVHDDCETYKEVKKAFDELSEDVSSAVERGS